jgi:hypothetical protein
MTPSEYQHSRDDQPRQYPPPGRYPPRTEPVPIPPPKKEPRREHHLLRFFIITFICFASINILGRLLQAAHRPGIDAVLTMLGPAAYLPLSLSWSASLLNQRILLLLLVAGLVIALWPCTLQDLATWLVPVGAGIILGQLTRTSLTGNEDTTS